VQPEDFCDGSEWLEAKPGSDPRLWATSDKELHIGDLVHVTGENGKYSGGGFFILAFVEGVNDDKRLNAGGFQRANNNFLHLRTKRLLSNTGVKA